MNPTDSQILPNNISSPRFQTSVIPHSTKTPKSVVIGLIGVVIILGAVASAAVAIRMNSKSLLGGSPTLPITTPDSRAQAGKNTIETPIPQASPVTINNPQQLNSAYQQVQTLDPASINSVVDQNNSYASQFSE